MQQGASSDERKTSDAAGAGSKSFRPRFVLRSNRATEIVWGPTLDAPGETAPHVSLPRSEIPAVVTPDGRYIALVPFETEETHVYDTGSGERLAVLPGRAQALSFSPAGTYVLTWRRKRKADNTSPNLLVWAWRDARTVGSFHQQQFEKVAWPTLQWTSDDAIAVRAAGKQVHVFRDGNFDSPAQRLDHKADMISVAPGAAPHHVAVLTPTVNTKPASVELFQIGHFAKPKARKSFFRSSTVEMHWAPDGCAVIVSAKSEFSDASYQGDSSVYFLSTAGESCAVPFEEGPEHCIAWAPQSDEFLLIAGKSRPSAQLFDRHCKLVFDLGNQARSLGCYSPHNGRFLALLGFSGMQGAMDFRHRFKKNKLIGSTSTDICAVSAEWSPCGRWLLTATTHPRLRMDNAYAIHKYNSAGPVVRVMEKGSEWELYQAFWLPCPTDDFVDAPPSPRGRKEAQEAKKARAVVAKKSQPYRARGSTGIVAAMMRDDGSRKGKGAVKPAAGAGGGASGAGEGGGKKKLSKAEKKRRAAERKAQEEAEAARKAEEAAAEAARQKALLLENAKSNPSALTEAQRAKRLKQVKKKLRQLAGLKAKRDEGVELNADQLEKLAGEPDLQEELASLESVSA